MSIAVEPCPDAATFLDAQRTFYRGDPHYVPPLTARDRHQLVRAKHPFFEHAASEFWLARRDGQTVGRISATRDFLHDEHHGDAVGFFGHFEAVDGAAARAVLERAAAWLHQHGATELRGPIDCSMNYRCGLLLDGEPGPPFVMMPHNPPEYADWIEAAGFSKAKDLLALYCDGRELRTDRLDRVAARTRERVPIRLEHIDGRRFDRAIRAMWEVYTSAWQANWGFAPMTETELATEARNFRAILRPELTLIASIDDRPVGIAVGIPNANIGTQACDGRLLPFGWWRFMRAMRHDNSFRTLTLGVRTEYRKSGLDALLLGELIRSGVRSGYPICEASWILEDNRGMLGPLRAVGAKPFRRYRIYSRAAP